MRLLPRSSVLALVAIVLTACGSEGLPADTTWAWRDSTYTITFKSDGLFAAKADCNALVGGYEVSGDRLTLRAGPSTMAECGPESSHDEYVSLLGGVDGFRVEEGKLILTYGAGAGEMVLTKVDGGK